MFLLLVTYILAYPPDMAEDIHPANCGILGMPPQPLPHIHGESIIGAQALVVTKLVLVAGFHHTPDSFCIQCSGGQSLMVRGYQ